VEEEEGSIGGLAGVSQLPSSTPGDLINQFGQRNAEVAIEAICQVETAHVQFRNRAKFPVKPDSLSKVLPHHEFHLWQSQRFGQ
jgi:hypothetical protein